jgi:SAM-dependent methyltransferase
MGDERHTGLSMRLEIAGSLSGNGVEFGAGSLETAFPVPPRGKVLYADPNTRSDLTERNYFQGQSLLPIDIHTSMEEMAGIADDSLDFIIASHVIEHTRNPILALSLAFKKLCVEGKLVLIVPDPPVTFDKDRPLTTIEHLIADFMLPSRERDFEHYLEFFRRSFPQPDPVASAKGVWELGHDIHFHTWSYESFGDFIKYVISSSVAPWREVWSHERLSDQDIEFYYILTK